MSWELKQVHAGFHRCDHGWGNLFLFATCLPSVVRHKVGPITTPMTCMISMVTFQAKEMIESDVRDEDILLLAALRGEPDVWKIVSTAVQEAGEDLLKQVLFHELQLEL